MAVDPVRDSRCSRGIGYGYLNRTVQEFFRVKYIINLFVFQKTVCMDTSSCHIKILSHKRRSLRDMITNLFFVILCKLCDNGGIHTAQVSAKLCIFKYHGLQWCISGTLSDAKQRCVDTAGTVQPCSGRIADSLIKIVMSVPLDELRRNSGVHHDTINNTRYGTRNHGTRIVYTISHGIAAAYLDRDAVLLAKLHQLQAERDDITVNIGSCDILQVASHRNAYLQAFLYNAQVMLHGLLTGHFHFIKNVVIRAAYQDTGFLHSHILYKLKILFACTDPARHLREFITSLHTFLYGVPVLFAVEEELGCTNSSFRSAQLMEIIVNPHNLFCGIRRS